MIEQLVVTVLVTELPEESTTLAVKLYAPAVVGVPVMAHVVVLSVKPGGSDPELMEALNSLSETEPIETLRVALDQMRHFLWFYAQVMNNEPEFGDKLRQARSATTASDEKPVVEGTFLDQLSRADELVLLHHMVDAKRRKPN